MFQKLQQRWGVSPGRMVLILCTFAIGGSLCGWAGRRIMLLLDVPDGFLWWLLYLVMVTVLWPVCVMLVSAPFGQFAFFKAYLGKMARRMGFGKRPSGAEKKQPAGTSDPV